MKSLRSSTALRKPARTLLRVGAMKTTRTSLVIVAAAAGLVAAAGPAQANPLPTKPNGTFVLPGTDTADDDGFCPFPVTIEIFSAAKVTETPLPDGGAEFRSRGHAEAIVTNDATGESKTYNISGPGTQTFTTAARDASFTIDAAGPNLLWTSVENSAPAGVLQLAYTTGRVRVAVDKDGNTFSYQLNGRTDVCDELAG